MQLFSVYIGIRVNPKVNSYLDPNIIGRVPGYLGILPGLLSTTDSSVNAKLSTDDSNVNTLLSTIDSCMNGKIIFQG